MSAQDFYLGPMFVMVVGIEGITVALSLDVSIELLEHKPLANMSYITQGAASIKQNKTLV